MNRTSIPLYRLSDIIAYKLGYIRKDAVPSNSFDTAVYGLPIQPNSDLRSSPHELREIARRCETLRAAISIIKESVVAVPFNLSLENDSPDGRVGLERAKLIISDPNETKESFKGLLRRLMEDLLILDA